MTWAIVLCRFRDVQQQTQPIDFFRNYFTRSGAGTGGAFDYWNSISYGQFLNNSEVFGWFEIPHDSTEIAGGLNRSIYQQWGVDAALANNVPLNRFPRRIFFFNGNGDHGAVGGTTTVFAVAPGRRIEPTFIFHEMGHTLGLPHSFSDSPNGCCGSNSPGEYCDKWDIMSAMCVFSFPGTGIFDASGPGLSVPYLLRLGWLDSSRVWAATGRNDEVEILPLNTSGNSSGFLAARYDYVDATSGQAKSYTVEFRIRDGWDRGIPNAAVLIHRIENDRSILVGSGRPQRPNLDWQQGDSYLDSVNNIEISVVSIDVGRSLAKIRFREPWESLGGLLTSGPGVCSWGQGRLDVFVRGTDFVRGAENTLWHKFYNNGNWSAWESQGGSLTSDPAAVSWSNGRIDVFARGAYNELVHKWYSNGRWSGWESLGGELTSGPGVCSWGQGRLDVFVKGTDNALWHKFFDGNWSDWESQGGSLTSDPAAVSWSNGRIDVFARGANNELLHKWYSNDRWSGWESLGGELTSGPGVCAWGQGRLDVFVKGTDNALWHKFFDGNWSDWESLGGGLTSDPDAVSWSNGRIDVFARGANNKLLHKWLDGEDWQP